MSGDRLIAVNQALGLFVPGTYVQPRSGGHRFTVIWIDFNEGVTPHDDPATWPHALKMERWKDFALRMAKTQYKKREHPDEAHILEQVELFFQMVEGDSVDFVNWDESANGEESVSNIISYWYDDIWYNPNGYGSDRQQRFIDAIRCADRHCEGGYYDHLVEKIADQYETPLHCCIRAGMDMCFEQSAGVLGFTVGTLREMWPEGIPDWLASQFERVLRSLIIAKECGCRQMSNNEQVQIGKKYRHFKGQIYKVYSLGVATKNYRKNDLVTPRIPYNAWTAFTSTPYNAWAESPISEGDTIVFYSRESGSGQLCWARSLSNFAETLEIKRFTEIEE
jgi:hypothetical protein